MYFNWRDIVNLLCLFLVALLTFQWPWPSVPCTWETSVLATQEPEVTEMNATEIYILLVIYSILYVN